MEIATAVVAGESVINAIGHAETDCVVRSLLSMEFIPEGRRMTVVWPLDGDTRHVMVVAQYRRPRLPEGATALPEGAEIEWWVLTVGR